MNSAINIQTLHPVFKDTRGAITDILVNESVDGVAMIKSLKGSIRGNHFHKQTTQWLYLVEGRLRVVAQSPGCDVSSVLMVEGDMVVTPANESHAIEALEDSLFIVLSRGPRTGQGYESDTFRLEVPLIQADGNAS